MYSLPVKGLEGVRAVWYVKRGLPLEYGQQLEHLACLVEMGEGEFSLHSGEWGGTIDTSMSPEELGLFDGVWVRRAGQNGSERLGNNQVVPFCRECVGKSGLNKCCGCGTSFGGERSSASASAGSEPQPHNQNTVQKYIAEWEDAHGTAPSRKPSTTTCELCEDAAAATQCRECDMHLCHPCSETWHKNPRRRYHTPTSTQASSRRTADHLYYPDQGEICTICSSRPAVLHGKNSGSICQECAFPAPDLKAILRVCEYCGDVEGRPGVLHCATCQMTMCPQCWAVQHSVYTDHRHVDNLYSEFTLGLLASFPAYKPFLKITKRARNGLVSYPLKTTFPHLNSLSLTTLHVPPHMRHDYWTRRYPYPIEVATEPSAAPTPPRAGSVVPVMRASSSTPSPVKTPSSRGKSVRDSVAQLYREAGIMQ